MESGNGSKVSCSPDSFQNLIFLLFFQTFPPLVKPNPIPRRSSRASSDVKEERDVKASRVPHSKENCGKAAVPLDHVHMADLHTPSAESSVQPLLSESEADSAGECPRKLVRKCQWECVHVLE